MSAAPQRLRERSERTRRCPPRPPCGMPRCVRRHTEPAETLPEPARFTGPCRPHRNLRTHAMAALQDVDLSSYAIQNQQWFRDIVAQMFWRWYEANLDTKVTTIKIWIIKKDIFVRDLRSIFELLFGPQPNGTTT